MLDKPTTFFVVGYALFLITMLAGNNIEIVRLQENGIVVIGRLFKGMRYFSYLCFLLSITYHIVERRLLFFLTIVATFLIVELTYSSNNTMLMYLFLFVGTIVVNAKTIIMTSFLTKSIVLFSTVFFSQLGIIQDFVFSEGHRNRHGLGFSWTTTSHILFLHILLEYIYLRREKTTIIEYVIMELLNWWFYKMTDTSMTFYIITLFVVYFIFTKIEKEKFHYFKKIAVYALTVPYLCALVSVSAQYFYKQGNKIWDLIDQLVHGRLYFGHKGITDYGLSLLGTHVEWIGFSAREMKGEYNYIDCSYLQVAIEYGLLFLLLVLMVYTVILYRGLKNKDYYLMAAVCFLLVFAMTEPRLVNLMYTAFPLLVLAKMVPYDDNTEKLPQKSVNMSVKNIEKVL